MKYRKKPIVIEATRWFKAGDHPEVKTYSDPDSLGLCGHPDCPAPLCQHGDIYTLGGPMFVCPGDWIIKGIKGEFYPCKPDTFEATYDLVEGEEE